MADRIDQLDEYLTRWMARHGVILLRIALGVVFLWFGLQKWFPGRSPVEELAATTLLRLSGGLVGGGWGVPLLGAWEVVIGVGLITGKAVRVTLFCLFLQMLGAGSPLFLFPQRMFDGPFVATLEGQFILKNLVLVASAIVVGATVRGGRLRAEP